MLIIVPRLSLYLTMCHLGTHCGIDIILVKSRVYKYISGQRQTVQMDAQKLTTGAYLQIF